jgi:integrase
VKPPIRWPREIKSGNAVVKVYRLKHPTNAGGWTYVVAWYQGGSRHREKFADPGSAISEARLKCDQIHAGEVSAAGLTASDRAELEAVRRLAGDVPAVSALKEWRRAVELTQGQLIAAAEAWAGRNHAKLIEATVADVIARFLKAKEKDGYQTRDTQGSIFEALAASSLGNLPIAKVTQTTLQAYLDTIPNRNSRLTHRKRIVTLWRWARQKDFLPADAQTVAERTTKPKEDAMKIGIVEASTLSRWLEIVRLHAREDLPALVLSAFCGLRRSEVHGQKWDDINLAEGYLRVSAAKEGTPANRLVTLHPTCVEWLMLAPRRTGPLCDGVAVDRVRKLGKARGLELPEGCTRHSWISNQLAVSKDIAATALEAGNSAPIIRRHYLKLRTASEAAAWFAVKPGAEAGIAPVVPIKEASA